MKARIERLRAELRSDRAAFGSRAAELRTLAPALASAPEGDRARAALALHHAYGAVESALERIARTVEGELPEGADWHQALLETMRLDIEGIRPRVLGDETLRRLHRLLAFRHFLRHAYAVALDGERLEALRADALALEPDLAADLDAFDTFLASLAADAER